MKSPFEIAANIHLMYVFPQLHTNRLHLRKIQVEDFPALVRYADNKKVSDNIVNIPYPFREPDAAFRMSYVARGFKNKTHYSFAIILKERQEFIGEISLHLTGNQAAQLGYWVGEPFWNQGIATEAARVVLQFGFEKLELEKVIASHYRGNESSGKVMTK
ncbi:MAG: GNAT family N-acetyltransferase, partial [Bacteroidota bacterium]